MGSTKHIKTEWINSELRDHSTTACDTRAKFDELLAMSRQHHDSLDSWARAVTAKASSPAVARAVLILHRGESQRSRDIANLMEAL